MTTRNNSKVRNIGIIAHVDAGKTTLTERLLYYSGGSHKLGDVDNGNTVTDFSPEERKRGITIGSAAVTLGWKGYDITIIDTPGHIDFNIEVNRSLRVLDGAVVVFDAVSGVEPQTETNWHLADQYQVPRLALVNKMDRVGADFYRVIDEIEQRLNVDTMVLQIPVGNEANFSGVIDLVSMRYLCWEPPGQRTGLGNCSEKEIPEQMQEKAQAYRDKLLDKASLYDDEILENLIDGEAVSEQKLMEAIRKAALANEHIPILCASAFKKIGVQPVLDAMCSFLPAPEDLASIELESSDNAEKLEVARSSDEAFFALTFKTLNDKHGSLAFVRVYSGQAKVGDMVTNPRTGKRERLGRLYRIEADKRHALDNIKAGDIAAVQGFKDCKTEETLTDHQQSWILESISVPKPVLEMVVEAKSLDQQDLLVESLRKLTNEDPSLQLKSTLAGEILLSGMGELHLEIVMSRLANEYSLEVRLGKPQVAFRETLSKSVEVRHTLKKQKGGPGQFAEIVLRLEPLDKPDSSDCIEFESRVVGTNVSREYIPAVEKGIQQAAQSGVLKGFPCGGFKAILLDGREHSQDSSALAFETAAKEAFREAAINAGPLLLEPIMSVEVSMPGQCIGDVAGDVSRRRGIVTEHKQRGTQTVLDAEVPLAEMFGYIGSLRSLTSGRANFSMAFSHYESVPGNRIYNA